MAERIVEGLHFPTSIAFDAEGRVHVAESGLPFDGAPPGGRVLNVDRPGGASVIGRDLRSPVTGLLFCQGWFLVSEGGNPGRISRLTPDGRRSDAVDGLPGLGNYHTNMALVRPARGWAASSRASTLRTGRSTSFEMGPFHRPIDVRVAPSGDHLWRASLGEL
jgi:hypothetical protein